MQYQSSLSRDALMNLAIHKYFANVDKKNMEATLACFHPCAMFTVQTAFTTHVGQVGLKRMFEDFFSAYRKIVHRDFQCTTDERNGRMAASFVADLVGHDGQRTLLYNTNFWRVRDDKFQEVYVYMSGANPLI